MCVYHVHPGQKTTRIDEARAAQRQLLERYRDEPWWSESIYQRRLTLNEAERLLRDRSRGAAARFLLTGAARHPGAYGPSASVLMSRRLRALKGVLPSR